MENLFSNCRARAIYLKLRLSESRENLFTLPSRSNLFKIAIKRKATGRRPKVGNGECRPDTTEAKCSVVYTERNGGGLFK